MGLCSGTTLSRSPFLLPSARFWGWLKMKSRSLFNFWQPILFSFCISCSTHIFQFPLQHFLSLHLHFLWKEETYWSDIQSKSVQERRKAAKSEHFYCDKTKESFQFKRSDNFFLVCCWVYIISFSCLSLFSSHSRVSLAFPSSAILLKYHGAH